MNRTKSQYISDQLKDNFIFKCIAATDGAILLFLIMLSISYYISKEYFSYTNILILIMIFFNVYRNIIAKNQFKLGKVKFPLKYHICLFLLNSACIAIITSILVFNPKTTTDTATIILLLCTVSGTLVINNVCHYKKILIIYSLILMLPANAYLYLNYIKIGIIEVNWLYLLELVGIIYVSKQSSSFRSDLIRRFGTEYDLKRSLQNIEIKSNQLEEQTLKTFHASRLSSLGEMAGGLAHEINNPLMIILTSISLIMKKNKLDPDSDLAIKLNKIEIASNKIASIVKGMKTISSNHDNIPKERVNLSESMGHVTVLFEEKFSLDLVHFEIDDLSQYFVKANPVQLSQIFINLLNNAYDAVKSLDFKLIQIKVDHDKHEPDAIFLYFINSGPLLDINVQQKIFEPFYTTKNLNEGTGLGLSISRSLAKENFGNLDYFTYKDKICFRLKLIKA